MAQPQRKPDEERPALHAVKAEEEYQEERAIERVEAPPTSTLAIAGLVISIVSLFLPVAIALFGGAAGVILGIVALQRIRAGERSGSGYAWASIIIGGIVLVFSLFVLGSVLFGGPGPVETQNLFNLDK